ncbi:MAG TPA: hypothetical protein VGL71_05090, partial [Urbifossiella sp.]
LGVAMLVITPSRKIYEQTFQLRNAAIAAPKAPGALVPAVPEKTQTFFTEPFDLKSRSNVKVTVSCPKLNGWLVAEGDLVQASNGQVQPFLVPLTHYTGTEDGEAWTEGDTTHSVFLSSQPGGQYSLKLEVEKEHPELTGPLIVTVDQGSANGWTWFLTCVALMVVPICVGIYHMIFSSRRWRNSSIVAPEEHPQEEYTPAIEPVVEEAPIPVAEEVGATGPPVARPIKRKKKRRPREEDDDVE